MSWRGSLALVHFYPLAGQMVTEVDEEQHSCCISIDCNIGPGAKFAHAALDMTVEDVLSPSSDVPQPVMDSLFDKVVINQDGHTCPLLSVQVTDLVDGIFIGCSLNHDVADGISFWHFVNIWSEIHKLSPNEHIKVPEILGPPILKLWLPDGYEPIIRLPYTRPDEFIVRFQAPRLREKFFHFSSDALAKLKAKAIAESNTNNISTFHAMATLVWRSATRSRSLTYDQKTICRMVTDCRHRLYPPLSQDYFGNSQNGLIADTVAVDLLRNSLGSAALLLKQVIERHTDKAIRDWLSEYTKSPFVVQIKPSKVACAITMTSSPRFDMYSNEFGLGKPLAIRNGRAGKHDGIVIFHPGREGGGSVDVEIGLAPESMAALETDEEFMEVVS